MDKKKFSLLLIFIFFGFGHFYRLNQQEFVGDEASPILLVDRAWEAIKFRDIKLAAFPFLWYHDPFRAVFAGSLIQLTGTDKIWLRLPGIFFSLAIYWLLVWIFKQEKISAAVTVLSLLAYSSAAVFLDYRLASGDSQGVFLILLAGYLIYKNSFRQAPWVLLAACLTMLDAVILIPVLVWKSKLRYWIRPGLIFVAYLFIWLALPYLAYRFGYQPWYENRGLWYYLSRVGEGVSVNPWLSLKALFHYSSYPFAVWLILSFVLSWFSRRLRRFQLITTPAWLAVFLLNRSSSHILMYVGLFFLQAVLVGQWLWQKNFLSKIIVSLILVLVSYFNGQQLYRHFIVSPLIINDQFIFGHFDVPRSGQEVDKAVKVLYQRYSTSK